MIASWMLYCSLCAFGLTLAAALAERALLRGRGPVRVVWIGAVLLSLIVPAVALRFAPRPVADSSSPVASTQEVSGAAAVAPVAQETNANPGIGGTVTSGGRGAIVIQWDQLLIVAWVTLSIAVAFNFFGGVLVLAWMRRRWQRREVLGVPVYVSERTGPAVVGVVRPAIVVPQWVLALEPAQLALMLRHEQEHRRAGDGRLLTMAQLALIVMPWNLAMWWQIFRLRVAVELDCDARVLREADARSYGDLLLEFARPRRAPTLVGVTAFAERAAQLERRIRLLARHRARTTHAARALATSIGVVALTVAWVAPRPPVPAREPAVQLDEQGAPPQQRVVQNMEAEPLTPPPIAAVSPPKAMEKPPVERPSAPASRPQETAPPCGGAAGRVDASLADSIFDRLFAGITLSETQAARVCALLAKLQQLQAAEDASAGAMLAQRQTRTMALRVQRDSALRALLTNDADRATFDARMARNAPGGRGRSGGSPDSLIGGRGGRGSGIEFQQQAGARQAGRGARGGGRGGELPADAARDFTRVMNDLMFTTAFSGITLTPEQEVAARAIITQSLEQNRTLNPPPTPILRMNPRNGLVSMSTASAAELSALLSNEADRATLQARIVSFAGR